MTHEQAMRLAAAVFAIEEVDPGEGIYNPVNPVAWHALALSLPPGLKPLDLSIGIQKKLGRHQISTIDKRRAFAEFLVCWAGAMADCVEGEEHPK